MAFQSTRPLRGGTCRSERMEMQRGISIHPPLAGRDQEEEMTAWQRRISIHPPLAGRDAAPAEAPAVGCDFNPPAPCGAGLVNAGMGGEVFQFQSTRPLRGGTSFALSQSTPANNFNPPAPCGAGPR